MLIPEKSYASIGTNSGDVAPSVYDDFARMLIPAIFKHLDNWTSDNVCAPSPEGDSADMAMKINRAVVVGGQKHWIRANTEQEYADKLVKLFGGGADCATYHDFTAYANNWFELYSLPNVSTATATTYKRQLKLYILPHFEGIPVEAVTVDDVQRLFNSIDGTKAKKDKVRMVLNMILKAAVEDGLLKRNPMKSDRLKIGGEKSKSTEPYSVEQMRYIVKNIPNVKNTTDRAFLTLMALHPLRLEETLGLKWSDIDFDEKIIHVRRAVTHPTRNQAEIKDTKTEASTRDIKLSEIALQYLFPAAPDDFVCGGAVPLSYMQVRRMRWRIEKNIKFGESIVPLRFRTTVLTDIYDGTKDIKTAQLSAGHTTSAMTLKHYVKGRSHAAETSATVIDSIYGIPS